MIHRQALANLFVLSVLIGALWLGLWPAVDAVTVMLETAAPEVMARELSSCCEDEAPAEGCACCGLDCMSAGRAGCSPSTATSTCQCSSLGGQLFLATAMAAGDLRLVQIGNIDTADQACPSREIQPPVPPPLHRLPTIG